MAISNLVLTRQIYSEETNGAYAHYREPVPLRGFQPRQEAISWVEKCTVFSTIIAARLCRRSNSSSFPLPQPWKTAQQYSKFDSIIDLYNRFDASVVKDVLILENIPSVLRLGT